MNTSKKKEIYKISILCDFINVFCLINTSHKLTLSDNYKYLNTKEHLTRIPYYPIPLILQGQYIYFRHVWLFETVQMLDWALKSIVVA